MPHWNPRCLALAAAAFGALLAVSLLADSAEGQEFFRRGRGIVCQPREATNPDLFFNFYVNGPCSTATAALYPAPRPTPPLVGHVYYTYEPLMPAEFLYPHRRTYVRPYDGGRGLNVTTVKWY